MEWEADTFRATHSIDTHTREQKQSKYGIQVRLFVRGVPLYNPYENTIHDIVPLSLVESAVCHEEEQERKYYIIQRQLYHIF